MEKKQSVLAFLVTAVLLTMVFAPLSGQQGGGAYDPWRALDIIEDSSGTQLQK